MALEHDATTLEWLKVSNGGKKCKKEVYITHAFTRDHSTHYYQGPPELNYGVRMGTGAVSGV